MALKSSMKILVVDDVATMRKIAKQMLVGIGFKNVDEAEDGNTAWEKIQQASKDSEAYEFIISDWDMPDINGLELLKKVRQHPDVSDTKFLMVTAEADQQNLIMAVKSGVNNYMVKPFSQEVLAEKIAKIFQPKKQPQKKGA